MATLLKEIKGFSTEQAASCVCRLCNGVPLARAWDADTHTSERAFRVHVNVVMASERAFLCQNHGKQCQILQIKAICRELCALFYGKHGRAPD